MAIRLPLTIFEQFTLLDMYQNELLEDMRFRHWSPKLLSKLHIFDVNIINEKRARYSTYGLPPLHPHFQCWSDFFDAESHRTPSYFNIESGGQGVRIILR